MSDPGTPAPETDTTRRGPAETAADTDTARGPAETAVDTDTARVPAETAAEGGARAPDHLAAPASGTATAPRGSVRTGADVGEGATRGPAASAGTPGPAPTPAPRRGAGDPVKALMHRHHDLCARAVDPLEIAAGLEAHGVTDRAAARFRHRDVFSLAEEMYARVPRDPDDPAPRPAAASHPDGRPARAALALLPGALCAAATAGVRLTDGPPRLAVAAVGALLVALGVRAALNQGPLHSPYRALSGTRAWTVWLLAYVLLGDGLLTEGLTGGPDGPWPLATAPVLALALACAPAVWCAHLFTARARRRLGASRGLDEFAALARPLLLGAFTLFLCALFALLTLCGALLHEPFAYAGAGTLGALLLLARLLTAHGFTHAPAAALATAGATEAMSLATVFGSRLPGCSALSTPVRTLTDAWGPGGVPAVACGTTAVVLLIHATRSLTRASAHVATHEPP